MGSPNESGTSIRKTRRKVSIRRIRETRKAWVPYWCAIDVAHPVRSLGDIVRPAIIKTLLACFFATVDG